MSMSDLSFIVIVCLIGWLSLTWISYRPRRSNLMLFLFSVGCTAPRSPSYRPAATATTRVTALTVNNFVSYQVSHIDAASCTGGAVRCSGSRGDIISLRAPNVGIWNVSEPRGTFYDASQKTAVKELVYGCDAVSRNLPDCVKFLRGFARSEIGFGMMVRMHGPFFSEQYERDMNQSSDSKVTDDSSAEHRNEQRQKR
ncbi:hypothetical protein PROFUN_04200 [Planoprotostelium fungivorum]|uniref:Uncharacterized protein n=1 Tax=Planoprotostelium fungivorum TaxID=1890364 RepID=A0A2P6NVX4_9EUKA|nr:hypothetical protein PROFUN_04200 [Planoprotostelium fungivorum]